MIHCATTSGPVSMVSRARSSASRASSYECRNTRPSGRGRRQCGRQPARSRPQRAAHAGGQDDQHRHHLCGGEHGGPEGDANPAQVCLGFGKLGQERIPQDPADDDQRTDQCPVSEQKGTAQPPGRPAGGPRARNEGVDRHARRHPTQDQGTQGGRRPGQGHGRHQHLGRGREAPERTPLQAAGGIGQHRRLDPCCQKHQEPPQAVRRESQAPGARQRRRRAARGLHGQNGRDRQVKQGESREQALVGQRLRQRSQAGPEQRYRDRAKDQYRVHALQIREVGCACQDTGIARLTYGRHDFWPDRGVFRRADGTAACCPRSERRGRRRDAPAAGHVSPASDHASRSWAVETLRQLGHEARSGARPVPSAQSAGGGRLEHRAGRSGPLQVPVPDRGATAPRGRPKPTSPPARALTAEPLPGLAPWYDALHKFPVAGGRRLESLPWAARSVPADAAVPRRGALPAGVIRSVASLGEGAPPAARKLARPSLRGSLARDPRGARVWRRRWWR